MIRSAGSRLTQKMLHGALAEINAADGSQREQVAQAVTRLFLRQSPSEARVRGSDETAGPDSRH